MPANQSKPSPAQWNNIQNSANKRLFGLTVLCGSITLGASLIRMVSTGFEIVYILQGILALGLIVSYFARNLTDELRIQISIGASALIAAFGAAGFGLSDVAIGWFIVAALAAYLYQGLLLAGVVGGLSAVYLLVIGILYRIGIFALPYDMTKFAAAIDGWAANAASLLALGSALVAYFHFIQKELLSLTTNTESQRQQFDTLLAMLPGGVIIVSAASYVTSLNAYAQNLIGKPADQIIGKHIREIGVGAIAGLEMKPGNTEISIQGADEQPEYFDAQVAAIGKAGAKAGYLIHLTNITRHKEDELSLIQLTQTLDQSPVSVIITDADGRIEYVNKYFTTLTGYSHNEALGKSPKFLNAPQAPMEDYEGMWHTVKNGKTWTGEFQNRKKNGEIYWEQAIYTPLVLADGQISNVIGTNVDITQQKQLKRDLKKSEEQAQQFILSTADAVFSVNTEGRILFANEAASKLLGHKPEQLTGGKIEMIVPIPLREKHARHRADYMASPQNRLMGESMKVTARRIDGTEIPVEIRLSHRITEQGPQVTAIMRDLSTSSQVPNGEELRKQQAKIDEQAKVIEQLKHQSENPNIDPETQIYTRRFLDTILDREFSLTRRRSQPLTIMMLEIDRLSAIREEYGAAAAEECQVGMAHFLQQYFRKSDVVCRYDDHVFLAMLPDMNLDLAIQRAEELKDLASAATVETERGIIKMTISLGVATSPNHGETAEDIVKKASKSLHKAHRKGNRYVAWVEETEHTA